MYFQASYEEKSFYVKSVIKRYIIPIIVWRQKTNGLFEILFEYTGIKDLNCEEARCHIPQNVTYRSPVIRNYCYPSNVGSIIFHC